jgi:alcohol dehydrogenase
VKAVYFESHGDSANLQYGKFADPLPASDEVRLRVQAVGLNWLDVEILRGIPALKTPLPMITGADCAGVIDRIGSEVIGWSPGEKVLVNPWYVEAGQRVGEMLGESRLGALAEYTVVRAAQLIRLPADISFNEAACLPVAYGTAHRMVMGRGRVARGEKVLVLGASGGVGVASVQLCSQVGAYVIAVASSTEKCNRLAQLGASETINSSEGNFVEIVRAQHGTLMRGGGVDIVINFVGGETWEQGLKCLKHHGRVLTCGAVGGHRPTTNLRYIFGGELTIIGSDGWMPEDLQALLTMVRSREMLPVISNVLPLHKGQEAVRLLEHRNVLGKVIVEPWSNDF